MSSPARRAPACAIGPDGRFEGLLSFRGAASVEGRLDGEVEAEGTLLVAEGARVRARVEADRLVVAGVLEGDVHARESVELLPTARVSGRLRTGRLVVAEGARLEGDVQTLRSPGASRPGDPGGASSVLNFE